MTYLLYKRTKNITFVLIKQPTLPMLRLLKKVFSLTVLTLLLAVTAMTVYGQQRGKASYYSRKAHGARTSSGERFNNDSLVCAHRTHPYGTLLKVKNPANGKEVIVKVIDRGPHGRGRIIDLSYEAARRLGILLQGVAMVEVSVYDDTAIPYKPKEYHIPELELEVPAPADIRRNTPEWQDGNDSIRHPHKPS